MQAELHQVTSAKPVNRPYPKYRRGYDRADVAFAVDYTDGNRVYSEYIRNISRGGMQVEALQGLEPGTVITISLPAERRSLKVEGIVRWVAKKGYRRRMGIEFINVTMEAENGLRQIISSIFWEEHAIRLDRQTH